MVSDMSAVTLQLVSGGDGVSCRCAGHTDAVMGAVILNDDDVAGRLRFLQNGEHLAEWYLMFTLHESGLLPVLSNGCLLNVLLFITLV